MSLFKQWDQITNQERNPQENKSFWEAYFLKEKAIYEKILSEKLFSMRVTLKEFSTKFEIEPTWVLGFLDGINSSLKESIPLETLTEDTLVVLDIEVEKLLWNMHEAAADWLFTLPQWDDVLPLERRKEIEKAYKASKTVVKETQIGRNDPCPCGSGLKYKKCCAK